MSTLHIIFATSTGHTEHVVDTLIGFLRERAPKLEIEKQRAELAKAEDLSRGDVLLLACGTWNTGGSEGQLQMYMHSLLKEKAKDIDLQKKSCLLIALGDQRYYYTTRAIEHLTQFVLQHNGISACDPLLMMNDPFGQEEKVVKWGEKVLAKIPSLAT